MAVTVELVKEFVWYTARLHSFPLFCTYLLIVLLSPGWQRFTKPLKLKSILVVYNLFLTIFNLLTAVGLIWELFGVSSLYQKSNYEPLRFYMWLYWISKQIELMDSIFMILRHKGRQLTFLHVYHHASMVLLTDAGYHTWYWPPIALPVTLNALVHVILYWYYTLAAMYPDNPPTWRKILTQSQILQFMIDLVFFTHGYIYYGFCIYGMIYGLIMIMLFMNFYYQAYIKTKPKYNKVLSSSNGIKVRKGKAHED